MALSPLDQGVIYTLAYSAQFHFPLTPREVYQRLVFKLDDQELLAKKPTQSQVAASIKKLLKQKLVEKTGEYLFLTGQADSVVTREQRQAVAAGKQPELMDFLKIVKACPWVEVVYVTGSMAMNNVEVEDDIDFLIVTQPRRLWLTRLWLLAQAMRRGKRRSWQGEEKGSWCFNLWLESDQLAIFGQQPSLYTAYELVQAQPIFSRQTEPSLLWRTNNWARQFLPLADKWQGVSEAETSWSEVRLVPGWKTRLLDGLNLIAYYGQLLYMRPHMTREKVGAGFAFFHPRDTQHWIYSRWQKVLEKVAQLRYD